jgi:hypothetical protein
VKRTRLKDINERLNILATHFENYKILQKLLLLHIMLLERLKLEAKKSEMDELGIFALFLIGYFSKLLF